MLMRHHENFQITVPHSDSK